MLVAAARIVNYHMNIEIQQTEIILFLILNGGEGGGAVEKARENLVTNDVIFMLSENVFVIQIISTGFGFRFWFHCHHFPEEKKNQHKNIKTERQAISIPRIPRIVNRILLRDFPLFVCIQCRFLVITIRSESFVSITLFLKYIFL